MCYMALAQALASLQTLTRNRHSLSSLSNAQVKTLQQVLQHIQQGQGVTGAQQSAACSHVYQLLTPWASTAAEHVSDQTQLQQAVTNALQFVHLPWHIYVQRFSKALLTCCISR